MLLARSLCRMRSAGADHAPSRPVGRRLAARELSVRRVLLTAPDPRRLPSLGWFAHALDACPPFADLARLLDLRPAPCTTTGSSYQLEQDHFLGEFLLRGVVMAWPPYFKLSCVNRGFKQRLARSRPVRAGATWDSPPEGRGGARFLSWLRGRASGFKRPNPNLRPGPPCHPLSLRFLQSPRRARRRVGRAAPAAPRADAECPVDHVPYGPAHSDSSPASSRAPPSAPANHDVGTSRRAGNRYRRVPSRPDGQTIASASPGPLASSLRSRRCRTSRATSSS